MSLINDALRRASQSERDRPHWVSTPMGMEPVPVARRSWLSMLLVAGMLVALLMGCWCFWQWWMARNNLGPARVANNIALTVKPRVIQQPVAAPKPAPVAPAAPGKPAPAPVVVSATPVTAKPVAAPPVAPTPQAEPPSMTKDNPPPWPVELKLNAIFFSKVNPLVLINGNLHGVGDLIQGVAVKKIEKNEVTVEWNGYSKVLMLGGD
jgi:hypothetical protein